MGEKMRLVTRSDFDGLACAMMLKEMDLIDDIKFVHPKDVQDGKVELSKNDITTNLPYDPRVALAFDHHESEVDRLKALETGDAAELRQIMERVLGTEEGRRLAGQLKDLLG